MTPPYILYITPYPVPAHPPRLPCCAGQLQDQQRLSPDPLPRSQRDQPQLGPVGQRRRHSRPLPQRPLLLHRYCSGHRDPLRDLHQPQAIRQQPNHSEHQETTRTRASKAQDLRHYAPQPLADAPCQFPIHLTPQPGCGLPAAIYGAQSYPCPRSVRWIGAEHLHREFQGTGAIIAMAAPPDAWTASWPGLPDLSSVQLVYVNRDGTPAVDRGLTKRTYAPATNAVIVLGCPHLQDAPAPVNVAEGLADVLALAARSPAPAVATLGTSGMASAIIAKWLATSQATRVWADRDESKEGRAPPGQRHGRELVRLVNDSGGNATALHTPVPHKDPAEAAAAMEFSDPDPAWPDYARTLSETTDWPRWEIARQAMAQCVEEV